MREQNSPPTCPAQCRAFSLPGLSCCGGRALEFIGNSPCPTSAMSAQTRLRPAAGPKNRRAPSRIFVLPRTALVHRHEAQRDSLRTTPHRSRWGSGEAHVRPRAGRRVKPWPDLRRSIRRRSRSFQESKGRRSLKRQAVSFALAKNGKRRVSRRAFLDSIQAKGRDYRSFFTPSKRESQGLTIMPFTSLRKAAVSTTSENGWIDMTISSM